MSRFEFFCCRCDRPIAAAFIAMLCTECQLAHDQVAIRNRIGVLSL